jgi:hypothetical protein
MFLTVVKSVVGNPRSVRRGNYSPSIVIPPGNTSGGRIDATGAGRRNVSSMQAVRKLHYYSCEPIRMSSMSENAVRTSCKRVRAGG